MIKLSRSNQQGFTIIELMIATAIFSMLLVVVSVMMINVGNLYYKGVNQSRVQDNVRSIADELSSHLQLTNTVSSGIDATTGYQAYCIGNTRYSYVLNKQLTKDTHHVLWRDTFTGICKPVHDLNVALPSPLSQGGTELITPNSRLTDFTVSATEPYAIDIGVAYGDADLFNQYDPVSQLFVPTPTPNDTLCLGGPGQTYCATAYLNTSVTKRLQ